MTNSPIQALYLAFFQRPADPAGLAYWNSVYASNGGNLTAIAFSFANSAEFGGLIAGKPLGDVIDALYTGLFGRPADPAGLQYWRTLISVGAASFASVGVAILNGVQSTDQAALNNRTNVADQFTTTVANGNATYDGSQDTAKARDFMKTVTADSNTVYNASQVTNFVQNNIADPGDKLYVAPTNPTPAGQTFTLTAGTDTVVGGDGNDTITGNGTGLFASPDNINGGGGTDTLTVTDSTSIDTTGTTVTNVEVASLTSTGNRIIANTTGWTGLGQLSVSAVGSITVSAGSSTAVTGTVSPSYGSSSVDGGSSVTVTANGVLAAFITVGGTTAPTGAISVSSTTSGAVMGAINVTGGTTVSVTQAASNAVGTTTTMGAVTVTGKAGTTAVTVSNSALATASGSVAGVTVHSITIDDVNKGSTTLAGTITSATLSNFTTATINDNGLTTLKVTGGSGNITIVNSGLTVPTNTTLGLTINGETGGGLIDSGVYTTLNLATTGANSTLANISMNKLTALNVSGTKVQTLTSTAGMNNLATVTVSGSAGLTADLTSSSFMTSVDASATSGANTITLNGGNATYSGGSGVDKLTLSTGATKAISLGDGDDQLTLGALVPTAAIAGGNGTDTLSMGATAAATASGSGAFAGLVTSFERLVLTGSTNQDINLAVLGSFSHVTTSGGVSLTLTNLPSGGTLVLNGAGTAYTISNAAFSGGADVVNLTLTNGSGTGVGFASTGITASGVETFNITTADTQATPTGSFNDQVTLLGNSVKTIAVAGNAGLTLTSTSTLLTSVDASGITLGGFTWTSGALAGSAAVKGSATGTNTIVFSAATGGAVTYTGADGNDNVTGTNGQNNVVSLGNGTNSFISNGGKNTVTGGTGNDTVTLTSGHNTITLGNGTNAATVTSGNNTITGGTGNDTFTVGAGVNTLTVGSSGTDSVTLTAPGASVSMFSTITDAHAGLSITFADLGTETFNPTKVTGGGPVQALADAVVAAGGNASANGAFGWFQSGGDTYLVESRHDGTTTTTFVDGTDMIVKLTGLIDLSTATGVGTATLTLV